MVSSSLQEVVGESSSDEQKAALMQSLGCHEHKGGEGNATPVHVQAEAGADGSTTTGPTRSR